MDMITRNYKEQMIRMSKGHDGLYADYIVTWSDDRDEIRYWRLGTGR